MVAVRCGDEHHFADGGFIDRIFQVSKADCLYIEVELAADDARQRVQSAKALERVQSEAFGLVLDENRLDAQPFSHAIQPRKRRPLIIRQFLMDAVCGGSCLCGQKVRAFAG